MVEARGLEAVAELVREPLVLAEHDAHEHRAPFPFEPRGDRARDVRAKPIGDAADTAAPADDPPVAAVEHDVNAAARQPAALVEAVFGAARRVDPRTEGEDGALGRRAAHRQLEQDTLPERAVPEPAHLGGHAQRELCLSHRTGHDGGDRGRAAELRLEQAAVERSEPGRAEPPAGERERQRAGRQPRARVTAPQPAAARTTRPSTKAGARAAFASASPRHAASTSRVGQLRSITATRARAAARCAPGRCRGSRRGRRPSGSRRAPTGSRRSSARSPARPRAARRAARRSPSRG